MIKQMRLKNCQSWEDQTIELATDKVNVIAAPNNTGKSVLLKLLRLATDPNCWPREEINQLIRTHTDHAEFITSFYDGAIGATIIYRTGIIYQYTPSIDIPFTRYEYPPQEYVDNLGLVTNSKGFIANIIDKNQDLLLVESDTRGNEEFMKLLTENNALSEGQANTKEEIDYIKDETSKLQFRIQDVTRQIDDIQTVDINRLEYNINHSSQFYKTLEGLIALYDITENIASSQKDETDYNKILNMLDLLSSVNQTLNLLQSIERNNSSLINKCECILQLLGFVSVAKNIKVISGIPAAYVHLVTLLKSLEELTPQLISFDTADYEKQLNTIDAYECLSSIVEQLDMYESAQESILKFEAEIAELKKQLESSTEKYTCPIYGEVFYNGKECLPTDI